MAVAIVAAPIDFDRDNPSRNDSAKLVFQAGLGISP